MGYLMWGKNISNYLWRQENGKNTFDPFLYFYNLALYNFSINFLFNAKILFDKIDNDALNGGFCVFNRLSHIEGRIF